MIDVLTDNQFKNMCHLCSVLTFFQPNWAHLYYFLWYQVYFVYLRQIKAEDMEMKYRVKTKNDDRYSAQLQDLTIQILTFPHLRS